VEFQHGLLGICNHNDIAVPSFILSGAAPLNKSENRRKRRDFVGRRAPRQDGL
jgi:hypothetical protein